MSTKRPAVLVIERGVQKKTSYILKVSTSLTWFIWILESGVKIADEINKA
jgi:hypothetical protein